MGRPKVARTPLTAEQKDLAETYAPLARLLARRFSRSYGFDRGDLEGVAEEALVVAAGRFRPDLKDDPKSWFGAKIAFGLRDWVRAEKVRRSRYVGWLPDLLPDRKSPPPAGPITVSDLARTLIARCTPQERTILNLYYLEGLNEYEIAFRIDLAVSRINFVRHQALAHLRGSCK